MFFLTSQLYSSIFAHASIRCLPNIEIKPVEIAFKLTSKLVFLTRELLEAILLPCINYSRPMRALVVDTTMLLELLH